MVMCAADVAIHYSGFDLDEVNAKLNDNLKTIADFFDTLNLRISINKSQVCYFYYNNRYMTLSSILVMSKFITKD